METCKIWVPCFLSLLSPVHNYGLLLLLSMYVHAVLNDSLYDQMLDIFTREINRISMFMHL